MSTSILASILAVPSSLLSSKNKSQTSSNVRIVTAVVLLAVPLVYLTKLAAAKKKNDELPYPPGPKGVFFFGNTLDFPDAEKGGHLDTKCLEWAEEYGPVYTLDVPIIGKMIMVGDPELIKYIYVTKNYPKSFTYKLLKSVLGERSMVMAEGQEWAQKRKAFNPGFAPNFLKEMVPTMIDKLNRLLQCIDDDIAKGQPTNMLQRSQVFTSDVIVSIAFGEDWGGKETHPARFWLSELARLQSDVIFKPFVLLFDLRTKWFVRKYENLLDAEFMSILDRRIAAGVSDKSKDICSLAINNMKGPDGSLTEDDKISITHQLKTFYFAGHDTTAILISWCMWLISHHDDVLNKIREELVQNQIWTDFSKPPSYDDLQKCVYLEAVLKEALRLYTPVSVGRYTADTDQTYQGYKIGGAVLILNTYILHRHSTLWKEPHAFRPERFLDGSEENISKKFLPFSLGPRDCIGKYFAYLEGKIAVSAICMRYDMVCVDRNESIFTQLTNLPRNGAQVVYSPRASK